MIINEYIKVGIVGVAGYTAGELLRILANHPAVKVVFAQSGSHAGEPVWVSASGFAGRDRSEVQWWKPLWKRPM